MHIYRDYNRDICVYMYRDYIGLYRDYLGLFKGNGEESGNYYVIDNQMEKNIKR